MNSILITGAAQSGKSTAINALEKALSMSGYTVFVLHETATELLKARFDPNQDRLLFQRTLFELQCSRESIYRSYINSLKDGAQAILLLDRGLPDSRSYVSENDFNSILSCFGEDLDSILSSYDSVIQLQTSALIQQVGKKNNRFRLETNPEQCLIQDELLRDVYSKHRHYHYVLAEADINKKLDATLSVVQKFCL